MDSVGNLSSAVLVDLRCVEGAYERVPFAHVLYVSVRSRAVFGVFRRTCLWNVGDRCVLCGRYSLYELGMSFKV